MAGLAWNVSISSKREAKTESELVFPSMLNQINDITSIEITGLGQHTKLMRNNSEWAIVNRDSYPANRNIIAKSLLEIADLRIIEAKSALPEGHQTLGLLGPHIEPSISRKVLVKGKNGQTIIDLLIGKSAPKLKGNYILKNAQAQSWLTRGAISISPDPMAWLNSEIMDIASERIKQIKINGADQSEIHLSRKTSEKHLFFLNNIPNGYEVKSQASLANIASLAEQLRFVNVGSRNKIRSNKVSKTILITTFDGLVIEMSVQGVKEKEWVEFQFVAANSPNTGANPPTKNTLRGDSEQRSAPMEANDLTNQTDSWAYVLPDYKQRIYKKSFASLIKETRIDK